MKRTLLLVTLVCCLAAEPRKPSFSGKWTTTYGPLTLTQKGTRVEGVYVMGTLRCTLQGTLAKGRLTFTYQEGAIKGEGWFELAANGNSFRGKWRANPTDPWANWIGTRTSRHQGFAGLWSTTYGRMRLMEQEGKVQGVYGAGAASTIEGKRKDGKLTFNYQEPGVRGEGWFELSADRKRFHGKWREQGQKAWHNWTGERVERVPGRQWLVVLEANWEKDLNQQEYAFGKMLRAFFARSAKVRVRHRYFTDAASLSKWCREVTYLAEPVVLVIATHGTRKGVTVGGKTIGARTMAKALQYGDNIRLLHFSSCELMKDSVATEMVTVLKGKATFPISGYRRSVAWATSAVIEFMYYDLILLHGLTPREATVQVRKVMPIAGDKRIPGAVLAPAGLHLVTPTGKKASK